MLADVEWRVGVGCLRQNWKDNRYRRGFFEFVEQLLLKEWCNKMGEVLFSAGRESIQRRIDVVEVSECRYYEFL